ncbi:MAG TPA: hypothetical protein VHG52_10355 [Thermomicrobiales bacterium]|nr:hypothetical protein [Thermomicrobiales bacterium]
MSDNEDPLILRRGPADIPPFGTGRRENAPQSGEPPLPTETGEGLRGDGQFWREALPSIADRLRQIGYDIVSSQSSAPQGGSIVARRDRGDRVIVLAVDAGGRFRAEITWVVGEWPSRDEVAGVAVRVVDSVSRLVTITGQLSEPEQLFDVIAGLGAVAAWESAAGSEAAPVASED